MNIKQKETMAGWLFAAPCIIGNCIFIGIPFIISLYYCFTKNIGKVKFVGIKNFTDLLNNNTFLLAFKNTLRFNSIRCTIL